MKTLKSVAHRTRPGILPRGLACLLALVCAACGGGKGSDPPAGAAASAATSSASAAQGGEAAQAAQAAQAAASGPPVSVTVVSARQRDVPVLLQATGSVVPVSSVDVRPQVTSVVTRVAAREGQFVRAGELLFTLDARNDEANVAKLRAQMAKSEAALADAQRQLARSRELLAQNFISQGAVDTNQTLVESSTAVLAADRAALEAARLTLAYSRVSAPGAGRVGAINVFAGSSVVANQTSLVTITQLDPIDVAFSVPQRHLTDVLAALKDAAAVSVTLPEGAGSITGKLQFVDNAIDAASGTIKVKARFDNKQQKLWPGAFVGAALTVKTIKDAVVVPQAAIAQTARGTIVFAVVGGKAMARPVEVVAALGEEAAVSGLKAGERVVVDGRQNLRPGATVQERAREGGRGASGAGGASGPGGGRRGASAAASGATQGAAPGAAPGSTSGAASGATP
jgi:RND family efflux transporter MFP subunit